MTTDQLIKLALEHAGGTPDRGQVYALAAIAQAIQDLTERLDRRPIV